MDLDAYVNEHNAEWRRLDELSRRRRLNAGEADELVALYQRAATHLSLIRSRSPDPILVARLSRLVLAGRNAMTGTPSFSMATVGRFFTHTFPLTVYRAWPWWCGVATAFSLFTFTLIGYVAANPEVAGYFMSDGAISALVNNEFEGYYSQFLPQNQLLRVWTNNALLTGEVLASGVIFFPVVYLLFNNALNVGLIGGVMIAYGRGDLFFGLIVPHGLLELTAVFIGAGVGLRIGWSWVAPGPLRTRGRALAETASEGMLVALGLVGVLLVSGLLEAFVTPSPLPNILKDFIGFIVWGAFLLYVFILGRNAEAEGASAAIEGEIAQESLPAA
ncbi:stage II sporulation protein M [Dactylosporangium matsuzakiense]|uniref:Membrane protein n=1 Tax=Dactylosporangium matsuzakiense TaxID=53360 RepID=A0A9W6NSJ9_9ACTN|nr:stage II sporulation protein M [Dactylosporangium matsuzakiense]UWZ44114.1 stage II sporulation protein M [Dactylosporangium matsuzakiense]GLL07406.1 membrane protein [Dactylosporangium matsuzakiense]